MMSRKTKHIATAKTDSPIIVEIEASRVIDAVAIFFSVSWFNIAHQLISLSVIGNDSFEEGGGVSVAMLLLSNKIEEILVGIIPDINPHSVNFVSPRIHSTFSLENWVIVSPGP